MNKKRSTVIKSALLGIMAMATSLSVGLSACKKTDDGNEDSDNSTTKIDTQVIKNGNFEFYSHNKGIYPICTPNDWTGSTNGNSSASMSGIIDTRKDRWDYITDESLPDKLEENDAKKSSDDSKKDYNGAMPDDLPYKNTHLAIDSSSEEEDARDYIPNPFTHEYRYDNDGKYYDNDGNEITVYANEDEYGRLYLDEDYEDLFETSVLMIHNYRRGYYTGTETSYKSGTTLTLEANTACEVSVWVKTCDLTFDGAKSTRTPVEFERGAYIKVETQVGGNSLSTFIIRNINTEKLNPEPETGDWKDNGWVQYTIYVEASTFAETTINLTLGLGESSIYTVEGYAFFDDITYTKYLNPAKMAADESSKYGDFKEEYKGAVGDPICYPLEPDPDTEFRVDVENYQIKDPDNPGKVKPETKLNYSENREFLIDCASTPVETDDSSEPGEVNKFEFDSTIQAGLTVEETSTGKFVSSKGKTTLTNNILELNNGAYDPGTHTPTKLGDNGLDVSGDILLTTTITGEGWSFNDVATPYKDKLTEALKTAVDLPGVEGETSALVILSALGAPYEARIGATNYTSGSDVKNGLFTLKDGKYALISFWIKTEDMKGNKAATITAVEVENGKETKNSASFTIDSTKESTINIGEEENVYNDWVRCFIRVSNTSKTEKSFIIKVNLGETTIKGTSKNSYTAGWLALVNPSYMNLSKEVYGHSSTVSHSATLSFTEESTNTSHNFDSAEESNIKKDIATPGSYTGINGASIHITAQNSHAGSDEDYNVDYNKTNSNPYAGLINKEYFESNNYEDKNWYQSLTAIANSSVWKDIFSEYTVQPLLIVNTVREFNEQSKIYNYGFVGNSSSIDTNGYVAVSVKVKASAGAIANVYLVEDKTSRAEVLKYNVPEFNFWYDSYGNILKGEPKDGATSTEKKENIAYTLRKDGLYENGDGKLYANFYNLEKYYDLSFEHESFFDEKGNPIAFEKLETGKTYYANADKTKYAPHYLIAGGNGNSKVYCYNEGIGDDATYFYMENSKVNTGKVVYGVNKNVATLRYDESNTPETPYKFTIDTNKEGAKYAGKWVTVTFYIHAGARSKNYRLELWSGYRDEESSYGDSVDSPNHSYVVFDYSSISLDKNTFEGLRDAYVNEIIADYREMITAKLDDNNANIKKLEEIAALEHKESTLYNYEAKYYTFSLYDSPDFIPFNGETADKNQSGYSYDYTEYEEQLSFLRVVDDGQGKKLDVESESYTMAAFIDYSPLDQDIAIIGIPTVSESGNNNNNNDSDKENNTNFWLLFTSIVLVVVIFVAMIAIFIRDFAKKHRRGKTAGKNSYNFNKNKKYVRKYVKANGEAPVIVEDDLDESILTDAKNDENVEAVDVAPAEENAENVVSDEANEAPSTETPAEISEATGEAEEEKTEDGEKPNEEK